MIASARSPLLASALTASDIARFWSKVSKADHPKGCWCWTASGRGTGYGCLKIGGRVYDVHRLSWLIHFGDIPAGMLVCHKCDNRICIRPGHLFLGTPQDNVRDMIAKGRDTTRPIGERCHNSKATAEIAAEIRRLARTTEMSYTEIGNLFGIERTPAAQIGRGRCWKHILEPVVIRRPSPSVPGSEPAFRVAPVAL